MPHGDDWGVLRVAEQQAEQFGQAACIVRWGRDNYTRHYDGEDDCTVVEQRKPIVYEENDRPKEKVVVMSHDVEERVHNLLKAYRDLYDVEDDDGARAAFHMLSDVAYGMQKFLGATPQDIHKELDEAIDA